MRTIKFESDQYQVLDINYTRDEDGKPCDIIITSPSAAILDDIADNHSHYGYNLVPNHRFFSALYARLDDFTII